MSWWPDSPVFALCVRGVLKHKPEDFFRNLESDFIPEGEEHPCGDGIMGRSGVLRDSDGVRGSPGLSVTLKRLASQKAQPRGHFVTASARFLPAVV